MNLTLAFLAPLLFILHPALLNASVIVKDTTSSGKIVIGSISVKGNRITNTRVVLREIPLRTADTLASRELQLLLEKARQNLLNTSLFNFVEISTDSVPGNATIQNITVHLVERWYIWPSPFIEIADRNFNAWLNERDFTRLNYGLFTEWNNFNGQKDVLQFLVQLGKNEHFSIAFNKPYLDNRKRWGFGLEVGATRSREVPVSTAKDKVRYFSNHALLNSGSYAALRITLRQNIYSTYLAEIRFNRIEISDTLITINPRYFFESSNANAEYLSFYLKLKVDHRDYKYYPLTGWYMDVESFHAGMGLNNKNPVNFFWLKTTQRFFKPIARRWYSGISLTALAASDDLPFYYRQGLGYQRDFVRGYEYQVADGRAFALIKSTLRYALIPERKTTLPRVPWEQFSRIHYALYLTAFADAGIVRQNSHPQAYNELPGSLMAGIGTGIDFVTYYDWVMRAEFSLNRSGKSGIFIHLIAGI